MNTRRATVTVTPVPSEERQGWEIEFAWDTGKRQRVLNFQSKEEGGLDSVESSANALVPGRPTEPQRMRPRRALRRQFGKFVVAIAE